MHIVYARCCGLDVRKKSITACVLLRDAHHPCNSGRSAAPSDRNRQSLSASPALCGRTDPPDESELRFDPSVPVQEILLANPEVADLPPDAYEVIGEKVTYRLAQRPGAYVILKYVRPVIKRKDTEAL